MFSELQRYMFFTMSLSKTININEIKTVTNCSQKLFKLNIRNKSIYFRYDNLGAIQSLTGSIVRNCHFGQIWMPNRFSGASATRNTINICLAMLELTSEEQMSSPLAIFGSNYEFCSLL